MDMDHQTKLAQMQHNLATKQQEQKPKPKAKGE